MRHAVSTGFLSLLLYLPCMASRRCRCLCARASCILLFQLPLLLVFLLLPLSPTAPQTGFLCSPLADAFATSAAAFPLADCLTPSAGSGSPRATPLRCVSSSVFGCGSSSRDRRRAVINNSATLCPSTSSIIYSRPPLLRFRGALHPQHMPSARRCSSTSECTEVGCSVLTYSSLYSCPCTSKACLSGRLSSGTSPRLHAAARRCHSARGEASQLSIIHLGASRISFLFVCAPSAAATAASVLSTTATGPWSSSTARLTFGASAARGPPATPAPRAASAASPAAVVSGPVFAAAAAASSAPASSSSSSCGWNTHPAWLHGVWHLRLRCFSRDCEREANEADGREREEGERERESSRLLPSVSATGDSETAVFSSDAPRLTEARDATVNHSTCSSSVDDEGKAGRPVPPCMPPGEPVFAVEACHDLPVLLRAFCSTKNHSSSSDGPPLGSSGRGSASSACSSSKNHRLNSNRSSSSSSSGRNSCTTSRTAVSDDFVSRSSNSVDASGQSTASARHVYSSSSSSADSHSNCGRSESRDWGDCYYSKGAHGRSDSHQSSQLRYVAATALHLLTPLQRRSLRLLQETIGFYNVRLEPAGVLHFELPARHVRRRVAATTAAAAAAEAAASAASPPVQRLGTASAGIHGSGEETHGSTQKSLNPRWRCQQQLQPLKQQQQVETQGKDDKQQQETEKAAPALGQQQLQQALQLPDHCQELHASYPLQHSCREKLQHLVQRLWGEEEEEQQHFQQQKDEVFAQAHQQQQTRQLQGGAPTQTCQSVHKQQQRPRQAGVHSCQNHERPTSQSKYMPHCNANVGSHLHGEQQGPAVPLLLQHARPLHVESCVQNNLQRCKKKGEQRQVEERRILSCGHSTPSSGTLGCEEKRGQQQIEECVPLSWHFTPASRRLVLLFWLPASLLMLRLSCEVRRRGPATCVYRQGPLCLPAAPFPVHIRSGLAAASPVYLPLSTGAASGAAAASSAAAAGEETTAAAAAAETQEDANVDDSGDVRGNVAAAACAGSPADRQAEPTPPCSGSTPVPQPAATARGGAAERTTEAEKVKHWCRLPGGVWGHGFLYACVFEWANCLSNMPKIHRVRQLQTEEEQREPEQREQQKKHRQQQNQHWPRQNQHGQSLHDIDELKDAQEGVEQHGHVARQPAVQHDGTHWEDRHSSDLLLSTVQRQQQWREQRVRWKSALLPVQAQTCTTPARVSRCGGMALLGEVSVHLQRPRLSTAATKSTSQALRPQQGFLILRTGLQRHAFLQELWALQQVQLQYLRRCFFPSTAHLAPRVDVRPERQQEDRPRQEPVQPPRQQQDEHEGHGQPPLQHEQRGMQEDQLQEEEEEQQQGGQHEEHTGHQQEDHQNRKKQQHQHEVKHPEQKKGNHNQKGQQQGRGDETEQDSFERMREQQPLGAERQCSPLQGPSPDVFKDLLHSVKRLFMARESTWCGAGRLLGRPHRRRRINDRSAEASTKGSIGCSISRKERAPARHVSVVTVAVNGKVVGWTLPPPPLPAAALSRFRALAAAAAAGGVGLPALLSCAEEDKAAAVVEMDAGEGTAVAIAQEEESAATEEEVKIVPAGERGLIAATERKIEETVVKFVAFDGYTRLVQGEAAAAAGEGEGHAAVGEGERIFSAEQDKQVVAAAAPAVPCQRSGELNSRVAWSKAAPTASVAPAVVSGTETRRRAPPTADIYGAEKPVNHRRIAVTRTYEGDARRGQLPKVALTGENKKKKRGEARERKQRDGAVCRIEPQANAASKREQCCSAAGDTRIKGAAGRSNCASVAASPGAQHDPGGKQKTTAEARVKRNVHQDVAAALLHPAVQRKFGFCSFCVKYVVYVYRSRLVNFVLQQPLLQTCSEEVP